MSNFYCEKCGKAILDGEEGYTTGCKHYPLEEKHILSPNMKGRISHEEIDALEKPCGKEIKETNGWEIEFDENFVNILTPDMKSLNPNGKPFVVSEAKDLKEFISQLLIKERQKAVEEIDNIDIKEHACRFNDGECNCDCYVAGIEAVKQNAKKFIN